MIDEATGKILGMVMAYGVSALGLFLAYVNYRKRTLGAARVMTPAAWGVVAVVVLVVAGGVAAVASLARPPAASAPETVAEVAEPAPAPAETVVAETAAPETAVTETAAPEAASRASAGTSAGEPRWPLFGILLPATIFLFATWITAALYRHFSRPAP